MAQQGFKTIKSIDELQDLSLASATVGSKTGPVDTLANPFAEQFARKRAFLTSDMGVGAATRPASASATFAQPGVLGPIGPGSALPKTAPKTGEPMEQIQRDVSSLQSQFKEAINLAGDPNSAFDLETASGLADRMKKRLGDALPEKFKPSAVMQKGGTGTQAGAQQKAASAQEGFANAPNVAGEESSAFAELITNPQFQLLMGNIGSAFGSPLGAAVSDSAKSRIAEELTRGQQGGIQAYRDATLEQRKSEAAASAERFERTDARRGRTEDRIATNAAAGLKLEEEKFALAQKVFAERKAQGAFAGKSFLDIYTDVTRSAIAELKALQDPIAAEPITQEQLQRVINQRLSLMFNPTAISGGGGEAPAPAGAKLDWKQDLNIPQ